MFTIIRSEKLRNLEVDLEIAKEDLKIYRSLYQKQLDKNSIATKIGKPKKEEENMTNEIQFTNFYLSKGRWYEVVRSSNGQFFKCNGFTTEQEAVTKAHELATHFPTETFLIVGPLRTVKANIPIVEEVYGDSAGNR